MRTPDKPGQFRITPLATGEFRLSGVRSDGRRIKAPFGSRAAAEAAAEMFFPKPVIAAPPVTTPAAPTLDDFGLPIKPLFEDNTLRSVAQTLGYNLPPPPSEQKPPEDAKTTESKKVEADTKAAKEKKVKEDRERAKGLCEMGGIGWAMFTSWGSKKLARSVDKEPLNPSPGHVKMLAKNAELTFIDLIGEREVKPWQMMLLLTFAMPISMLLQSPSKKKTEEKSSERKSPLASVP